MLISNQLVHFCVCQKNKIILKYSQQLSLFSTDKFVELLLFSIQLFETCRTFFNLLIVGAKKSDIVVNIFNYIFLTYTEV